MGELIKMAFVAGIFLVLAPLGGMALAKRPTASRVVFALMCAMTINGLLQAGNWGLTLASIERYRGHTKGYHFYFNQALALALIIARFLQNPREFKWIPPNGGLYLLYCACSFISIVNAPRPDYVWMSLQKMLFAGLLLCATYNYIRTEEDLILFVRIMAGVMIWQMMVCLKMKYLDHIYQVRGTFEHQNPLCMYAVMIGLPILAAAMGPPFKGANVVLFAFLACGIVVQCTLSRAGMMMFAAGIAGVLGLSFVEKPTKRRLGVITSLGCLGLVGLLLTLDTIVSRFNDEGNDSSSELRHVMNEASRRMLADHSLGIGWNNFALAFNPPFPYIEVLHEWVLGRGMAINEEVDSPVVESHYWLMLAETGWLGCGSYIVLIAVATWRNLLGFVCFDHGFTRCLSLGIGLGCLLNYVQSTLERVLVQPRNLMLWLILLGITARIETIRQKAVATEKAQGRRFVTLSLLFGFGKRLQTNETASPS